MYVMYNVYVCALLCCVFIHAILNGSDNLLCKLDEHRRAHMLMQHIRAPEAFLPVGKGMICVMNVICPHTILSVRMCSGRKANVNM